MSRVKASKKLATFLFKFNPRGGPIEQNLMKQTGILSEKNSWKSTISAWKDPTKGSNIIIWLGWANQQTLAFTIHFLPIKWPFIILGGHNGENCYKQENASLFATLIFLRTSALEIWGQESEGLKSVWTRMCLHVTSWVRGSYLIANCVQSATWVCCTSKKE